MRFKLNNSIKFYLLSLMLLVTLVVISCGFEASNKTEKKKENIKVQPIEVDSLIPLVSPESLGISTDKLEEIDRIVQNAIKSRALPGAQVVAIYDGKMFYRKSFGTLMYDENEKVRGQWP